MPDRGHSHNHLRIVKLGCEKSFPSTVTGDIKCSRWEFSGTLFPPSQPPWKKWFSGNKQVPCIFCSTTGLPQPYSYSERLGCLWLLWTFNSRGITGPEVPILGQQPSKHVIWEERVTCSHSEGTPVKRCCTNLMKLFYSCDALFGQFPARDKYRNVGC